MTTQNVIDAKIKAKVNERNRISAVGPIAAIIGGVIVFMITNTAIWFFGIGIMIAGIAWAFTRQKQKDKLNDEIEILMAEMEDA